MQLFVDWKMLARLLSRQNCGLVLKIPTAILYLPNIETRKERNKVSSFHLSPINTGTAYQKVNFSKLPAFRTATDTDSEHTVVCAINYLIKRTHLPLCSSWAMGWIFKIISTLTKFVQYLPMHIPHSSFPSQVKIHSRTEIRSQTRSMTKHDIPLFFSDGLDDRRYVSLLFSPHIIQERKLVCVI